MSQCIRRSAETGTVWQDPSSWVAVRGRWKGPLWGGVTQCRLTWATLAYWAKLPQRREWQVCLSIVPFRILFYSNLLFPIQFCSTPIFSTILLHCILLYLILFYYILLGFTFGKVILSIMIIYFGMFFSILFCSFLLYCTLIYSDLFCFVFYFILLSSALFYSIVLGSSYFYWFVLFFWILLLSSYMLTSVLFYSFPINFYSDFILFYSVSL